MAMVRPSSRDSAFDFDLQLFALSNLLERNFRAKWGEKKI
jgi:hypothetical protein